MTQTETDPWTQSIYLQGQMAPVHDELDVAGLAVEGELPDGLQGTFLRNGPNPAFAPIDGRYHTFDGDGMVHGVYIEDGKARYHNRWIESAGLEAERKAGRALYPSLAKWSPPDPELTRDAGGVKNTGNTALVRHAGRLLALLEASPPTELSAELDTVGVYDFGVGFNKPMTAHPKIDPDTGEMFFFGYSGFAPHCEAHKVAADGTFVGSVDIGVPNPVMMHDFVMSESSLIFFDLPASFDIPAMLSGGDALGWKPEWGARIGVLPRDIDWQLPESGSAPSTKTDAITWIEVDPFYVFHFLNAHDEVAADGSAKIVVDGCRSPQVPISFSDEPSDLDVKATMHRWTIDPAKGTVIETQMDDRHGEFPQINQSFATKAHRYGYMGHALPRDKASAAIDGFSSVVKYDLADGYAAQTYHYGDTAISGEVMFAPDPAGTAEDDGWLLTYVVDGNTGHSTLVVLDARDLAAGPVATVTAPRRIPVGFHALWLQA